MPQRSSQGIIRSLSLILFLGAPFASCRVGLPRSHHKHLEAHSGNGSIPHIIHQSWKTDEVPERFVVWQASWMDNHPTWEYRQVSKQPSDVSSRKHGLALSLARVMRKVSVGLFSPD